MSPKISDLQEIEIIGFIVKTFQESLKKRFQKDISSRTRDIPILA